MGSLTGNSPTVFSEKEWRRDIFMNTNMEIVCCQLQTPCFGENKNNIKLIQIPECAVSDTLLMSGFQNFAADAAFKNRAPRDFFTHRTKKNAISFPDFCQKA